MGSAGPTGVGEDEIVAEGTLGAVGVEPLLHATPSTTIHKAERMMVRDVSEKLAIEGPHHTYWSTAPSIDHGSANACKPFDNCTTMYCFPWCM